MHTLKSLREARGLYQKEVAAAIGVDRTTYVKYERGDSRPGVQVLDRLARFFGVSTDQLLGRTDLPDGGETAPAGLPEEAWKVARDYSRLDRPGKNVVKAVLLEEGKRVRAELARRRAGGGWEAEEEAGGRPAPRVIPLYFTPAAAGYASPAFGEDFEYLAVGGDVPRQADFAVRIDGDSMEPYLMDGSTAYVNRDPIADGDVGIFFLDGDMLCKQYHRDESGNVYLLSLNRNRADADRFVSADSGASLTCFGRVMLPHVPRPAE